MPGVGGHAALFAIEKDGDASGTFTVVPGITSEIPFAMTRNVAKEVPHGDDINTTFVGPMFTGPISFSGQFRHDHETHDYTTGLGKRYVDGDLFGFQYRGPNFSAGVDEVIGSGKVTNWSRSAPNDAGVYTFSCTIEPSGEIKVDGAIKGTRL